MRPLSDDRVREYANEGLSIEIASMAHELLCARQTLALHEDVCRKLNDRIDDLESKYAAAMLELAGRFDR